MDNLIHRAASVALKEERRLVLCPRETPLSTIHLEKKVGRVTYEAGMLPAAEVRSMFDRIAPVYDAMNRLMTAGLDQRWRRETVRAVVRPGAAVLDACCGTGDLAIAARRAGADRVVGLDFADAMLERARRKAPELEWVRGDLLELPFADATFDAANVGSGVRN